MAQRAYSYLYHRHIVSYPLIRSSHKTTNCRGATGAPSNSHELDRENPFVFEHTSGDRAKQAPKQPLWRKYSGVHWKIWKINPPPFFTEIWGNLTKPNNLNCYRLKQLKACKQQCTKIKYFLVQNFAGTCIPSPNNLYCVQKARSSTSRFPFYPVRDKWYSNSTWLLLLLHAHTATRVDWASCTSSVLCQNYSNSATCFLLHHHPPYQYSWLSFPFIYCINFWFKILAMLSPQQMMRNFSLNTFH